jgi:phosphate transport system permease protein
MSFRALLAALAGVVPASMIAILVFLAIYAWPAIEFNGLGFLGRMYWNLGNL